MKKLVGVMGKLLKFEFLTWIRNKRFFLLILVCLVIAFSSTIFAYHLKELMQISGGSGAKVIVPNPTAVTLIQAYMKTASQIGLFVSAYLVADACSLKKGSSKRFYYLTTARHEARIYCPRLIVGTLLSCLAMLIGALCSLYITWSYFTDVPFDKSLEALGVQLAAFCLFTLLAGAIGVISNSAFIAALIIEGIVLVGSYLDGFSSIHKWSPASILNPTSIVSDGWKWDTWRGNIVSALLLLAATVIALFFVFYISHIRSHRV
jgi:ABC-2 type transport system permease protein